MDVHELLIGLGLFAWGIVLLVFARWHANADDDRLARIVRFNWRFDRRFQARGMTWDEWLPLGIRRYRAGYRWIGYVFVLFLLLPLAVVIHALVG